MTSAGSQEPQKLTSPSSAVTDTHGENALGLPLQPRQSCTGSDLQLTDAKSGRKRKVFVGEELSKKLEENRAFQDRLREILDKSELVQASEVEQVKQIQGYIDSQLKARGRGVIQRGPLRRPLSAFSCPSDPLLAPPKNIDAVKRNLFREMQMGGLKPSLRFHRWTREEDEALDELVRKKLREETFERLYAERKRRMGDDFDVREIHKLFNGLREELKDMSSIDLFQQQLFKTDWKRIAREMHNRGYKRDAQNCYIRYFQELDPRLNKMRYTKAEDKALFKFATMNDGFDWEAVAQTMGNGRTAWSCFARYQQSLNPSLLRSEWTEEEDRQFEQLIHQAGGVTKNWYLFAARFGGGRHWKQFHNRWMERIAPHVKNGPWSTVEAKRLGLAVKIYGRGNWTEIAAHVSGRTPGSCLHRYEFVDLEGLKRDVAGKALPWTEEEDKKMLQAIEEYGVGNWSLVRRDVPGRTTLDCLRRFWRLNPERDGLRLADTYDQLLATKKMMLPSMVYEHARRSELVASDFQLAFEEIPQQIGSGQDAVTYMALSTNDPFADKPLRRVNERRRRDRIQQACLALVAVPVEGRKTQKSRQCLARSPPMPLLNGESASATSQKRKRSRRAAAEASQGDGWKTDMASEAGPPMKVPRSSFAHVASVCFDAD